ncbi:MAG: primosomal protein N' [Burkholderiaceae bacterium]|nr:primosomal protein N' [Burkholderiaceae bacterium]
MSPDHHTTASGHWLDVVVATPAHRALGDTLTYRHTDELAAGTLVRVPLGSRTVPGVVWACTDCPPTGLDPDKARWVAAVLGGCPPLNPNWRTLVGFAARYYQRSLGEVALAALPPQLRDLQPEQWLRKMRKLAKSAAAGTPHTTTPDTAIWPTPSTEQQAGLNALVQAHQPVLLFGATGSGKTEVYLQAARQLLEADPMAQVLVMVPEINLTPQLQQRFVDRFGQAQVALMHSGLTPAQRLEHWLAAHTGRARIVLGTRTAVLGSMPRLRLIVVDEEHDPSYKSQEGARYSARDLAIYRAQLETRHGAGCRVVLGSATPSLETWHAAQQGRYLQLDMPTRMGGAEPPALRLLDMARQPKGTVLPPAVVSAMTERAARGEQSLVLLNRRGYAPVLACHACGWKSHCPACSAYRVFHKMDRSLRCHHCGLAEPVPRACPDCGNLDISPVGKGTEQLEEQVATLLGGHQRPDGQPLRVARMDADTTRAQGSLETQLARVHGGEVDVLVGTQMVAKGHDFRRITLVVALNADAALFASDYRATERLFALLMQAGGRAGRDASLSQKPELWVPTWNPTHPLFGALKKHDYALFAAQQLQERQVAQMPPFTHQALLRAEARTQASAQAFLNAAREAASTLEGAEHLVLYPPVPLAIQRVAHVERAHMLLESTSRPALQHVLAQWHTALAACRQLPAAKGLIRWAIDVDPLSI